MMNSKKLFKDFFESEKTGGLILIICTALSLLIANSYLGAHYDRIWQFSLAGNSLEHWINDGLMVIFFLLIGLELKQEIIQGELSHLKTALLPVVGAIGGMLVPIGIFLFFNFGTPTQTGAGIPMATDIAFALGVLSLFGNKAPTSLKVFLAALAVIDDLGAILVIAFFYTKTLVWSQFLFAIGTFGILLVLNQLKIKNLIPYLAGGIIMWYFMLHSGVHATITGVLLACAIPFGRENGGSPSHKLQSFLHKPVAFIILPVFALACTAITIHGNPIKLLAENYTHGIALGLILGKPLGIFSFAFISGKLGICKLPSNLGWNAILGVGFLGGIGFTMSIFITLLSFDNLAVINDAKLIIVVSSLISGLLGYMVLNRVLR